MSFTLVDLAPERSEPPVLVVVTPGFGVPAFLPLAEALRRDGYDVQMLHITPAGQDAVGLAAEIAAAAAANPGREIVVAHGLGATLALMAAPAMDVEKLVLLAPVLDVVPVAATSWLADQPFRASVDLGAPLLWQGESIWTLLLGEGPVPLAVAPGPFIADVQSWIRAGAVPVDLEAVSVPVWVAVSLGDDFASVEAVVPASRRLPDRDLLRLGMNRFDAQDYEHGDMLVHPVPIRAAVRAARK